jgi:CDGSH iron-sulfur domain-containing protein 3
MVLAISMGDLYPPPHPPHPPPLPNSSPAPLPPTHPHLQVTIDSGKSVWACTCGMSKNYPYCDGAHKAYNAANGTKFAPKQVENTTAAPMDAYLCSCGHSKSGVFCDGSHRKVKEVAK